MTTNFEELKVTDLRGLAREKQLPYSGKNKKELVKMLSEHEETKPAEEGSSETGHKDVLAENEADDVVAKSAGDEAAKEDKDVPVEQSHGAPSSDAMLEKQDSDKHAAAKSSDATTDKKNGTMTTDKIIDKIHHPDTAPAVTLQDASNTSNTDAVTVHQTAAVGPTDPERSNADPANDAHAALAGTASENPQQGNVAEGAVIRDSERDADAAPPTLAPMALDEAQPKQVETDTLKTAAIVETMPTDATEAEVAVAGEQVTEVPGAVEANDAEGLLKRRLADEKEAEDPVAKKIKADLGVAPIGGTATLQ